MTEPQFAPFSDRPLREASDAEITQAIKDKSGLTYIEWPIGGLTFIRNRKRKLIIRTGALGGDIKSVHGGWYYHTRDMLDLDWEEIRRLPEGVTVRSDD